MEVGELTDDTGGRLKGTSSYILDLNGVKHLTRNKTDIAQREKDLHMLVFWLHDTVPSVVHVEDGLLERGNIFSDILGIVDLESL